ncbi:MAG TPA: methyltransferase domain-containing protein [Vicinamibacterales bacterium]|jgi:ubiquinone/menaquinone biosynthesis C-methylase UbiE
MFFRRQNPHVVLEAMTGIRTGDRLLHVGCADAARLGAVAVKVGLSGRAVAIVPDEASAVRANAGAADAGALVEVIVAPTTKLPADAGAFDVAIVDDTGGLLGEQRAEDRVASVRELHRVLRVGGRVVVIGAAPRGGFGALLTRATAGPPFVSSGDAVRSLQADGFPSARLLAERDGLAFAEGIKRGR